MDIFILFCLAVSSGVNCVTSILTISKENVVEGDNVTLMCSTVNRESELLLWSVDPGQSDLDLEFFVVNGSCSVDWNIRNNSMYDLTCCNNSYQEVMIRNVNRNRHRDRWSCHIRSGYSSSVIINVMVSSVEISPDVTSISMKENDVMELSCTSSYARPKPSVTWLVANVYVNGIGRMLQMQNTLTYDYKTDGYRRESDYLYSARSYLNFTADRSHHGLYVYCNASNYPKMSALSKPILINVMYAVKMTFGIKGEEGKDIIIVERNESVQLTCIADAVATNAKLLYKWDTVLVEEANVTSLTYSLDHMTCASSGVYSCVGRNEYSTKEPCVQHLTIFVKCLPQSINSQNISMASLGEPVTIRLSVVAYPEPKFTWMKKKDSGLVVVNNTPHSVILTQGLHTSLTIAAVREEDYGIYKVLAENEVGQLVHSYLLEPVASDKNIILSVADGSTTGALVLVAVVIFIIVLKTHGRFVDFGKCLAHDKAESKRNGQEDYMNADIPPSGMQSANTYETLRDDLRDADTEYQDMGLNETENTV